MNQLAICVPTYGQPKRMQEMMVRCIKNYDLFKIDVYIFDSSPDTRTEAIILKNQEKYHNLYYRHFPADMHSNIKVLEAYREIIAMGKYQYLWLCPDYIQLTYRGTERVLNYCAEGFDICVLNYRDVEKIGEKYYSNINSFFVDCAWHMSSYMASIVSLDLFSSIDWKAFYQRYTTPQRIHHSHVALYFEQLAKLQRVKAVHVPVSSAHMSVSSYRDDSLWRRDVFPIWCDYWPNMIRALPSKYLDSNKDKVIKKLGINTGILSWNSFVALKKEKIYTYAVYKKYKHKWKQLTNVPEMGLWMLAVLPVALIERLQYPSLNRWLMRCRLRVFGRSHKKIYIYGCGFMAKRTSILLDELYVNYCGYVVSDRSKEKPSFHHYPVIEYGELPGADRRIGVIMALSRENTLQVIKEKRELKKYDLFYMFPYESLL